MDRFFKSNDKGESIIPVSKDNEQHIVVFIPGSSLENPLSLSDELFGDILRRPG